MRILGIDPGLATVGFGIIDADKNSQKLVTYGTIKTNPGLPLEERLSQIAHDLREIIKSFAPDTIAVEELFFNTNVKTAITIAEARGVIIVTAKEQGVRFFEYTPLQVKQAVAGYGRADKNQVMQMTRRLLNMNHIPKPDDAADAIAIALCHGRSATSMLNINGGI